MAKYIEKTEEVTLPVIALRGAVAFPGVTLSFELEDELSIAAVEAAFETNSPIIICMVNDLFASAPSTAKMAKVGTISKIKHYQYNNNQNNCNNNSNCYKH